MKQNYGPWSTAINPGNNPQLSTFWKRRLTMLASTSKSNAVISKCKWSSLIAGCLVVVSIPTFLYTLANANEKETRSISHVSEERVLSGHNDLIWSVVFSPDGNILASGSSDTTVKIWNRKTGKLIKTLSPLDPGVIGTYPGIPVVFSPNGKILASGGFGKIGAKTHGTGRIKLWDTQNWNLIRTLDGHEGKVQSVAISPDGKVLASGSHDSTIILWNLQTGNLIRQLDGHKKTVYSLAFSPDGKTLASAGGSEYIAQIWDVNSGKLNCTIEDDRGWGIMSVAFSRSGETLATANWGNRIPIWDVRTGKLVREFKQSTDWSFVSVDFSPKGHLVVAAGISRKTGKDQSTVSLAGVTIWDLKTGSYRQSLKQSSELIRSVVFSPDGKTLATGQGTQEKPSVVTLWKITRK